MQKYFTRSNLGTAIGVIVGFYLLFTLVGVIKRNHDLQKQVNNLDKQITSLEQQKNQLNYQIAYYKTDAFKEQAARAKLGLVSPGESEIILPNDPTSKGDQTHVAAKKKPSHIALWWQFLFGG